MPEENKTSQKEGEKGNAQPKIRRTRSPNFTRIYTNNAQIGFSTWDMRMDLGEVIDQEDGMLVIEDRIRVVMSLHHAKAFITALVQSFDAFEKQVGDIKLISPPTEPLVLEASSKMESEAEIRSSRQHRRS